MLAFAFQSSLLFINIQKEVVGRTVFSWEAHTFEKVILAVIIDTVYK